MFIIADDTDGPVDSIAKRSVTSRGRVSRRPLEFWKNERFEYDINKEVKSFSQASLPPTPVRQVSCSDGSASETKSHTPASSRGASAAPKRQQPPATSASAAQSRRKRIVESSSESESSSDDDVAPSVQQRQRPPAKAKSAAPVKASVPAKTGTSAKAAASSKSSAAAKAATTKPLPSRNASSASRPQRVPARQPVPYVDSTSSDSDDDAPVPGTAANRAPVAARAKVQAAPQSKKKSAAPEVAAASPGKRLPRAVQAESKAGHAAPSSTAAASKSTASRAAAATEAQADSDDDIFESKAAKPSSKKADTAAVKFSSASALLSNDHAEADDDDDCTIYI